MKFGNLLTSINSWKAKRRQVEVGQWMLDMNLAHIAELVLTGDVDSDNSRIDDFSKSLAGEDGDTELHLHDKIEAYRETIKSSEPSTLVVGLTAQHVARILVLDGVTLA